MNFNSVSFIVFLAVVLPLRAALPWQVGRWLMVAASYLFYGAATPWYCLLLLASTLVDYFVAFRISAAEEQHRKTWLLVSIVVNLGLLATFKYGDFTIDNLNWLLSRTGLGAIPLPGFILPAGISFYTFQTLSYTIDVYRGKVSPTRDFGQFALYVAFFPQLVAGPIERAGSLLPQLGEKQKVSTEDFELGFQRMLVGFVKKLVLADRLAVMVDQVYAEPEAASAPVLLLAAFSFGLQLYLDFSSYADIAIGVARMMGVRLRENFNAPWSATNPSDFWVRWHMSLTSWFTDYVFRPMMRWLSTRTAQLVVCPIAVMALVGLWHGANWTFIYFGVLNGIGIVVYRVIRRATGRRFGLFGQSRLATFIAVVLTITYINFTVVFFRVPNIEVAWTVFRVVAHGPWSWCDRYTPHLVLFVAIWIGIFIFEKLIRPRGEMAMPGVLRGMLWFGMITVILVGAVDHTERFVYFQF